MGPEARAALPSLQPLSGDPDTLVRKATAAAIAKIRAAR
jgi:hypothetical protein